MAFSQKNLTVFLTVSLWSLLFNQIEPNFMSPGRGSSWFLLYFWTSVVFIHIFLHSHEPLSLDRKDIWKISKYLFFEMSKIPSVPCGNSNMSQKLTKIFFQKSFFNITFPRGMQRFCILEGATLPMIVPRAAKTYSYAQQQKISSIWLT